MRRRAANVFARRMIDTPSTTRHHRPVLAAVALLAVLPLAVHGCSCGHDFDFHLLSWFEAATQIVHGRLHPHWAFTPAWNAGEPRFVFYPPLSWYLGALLGLVLPWAATPIVYTWLALAAAGLACHRLLRDFAPPATALFAAALYIVNPYMIFTAYERTAYGELLCAAWLPLLLHGILRERVTMSRIALPVALLWLTNAPAAVLGCYALGLLTAVRLITTKDRRRVAVGATAGTAIGLGLAAVYIVPAAYERRYVEVALVKAQSLLVTNNFLFGHTADPDHDAVLHTASVLAVLLLGLTAVALAIGWFRNRSARATLLALGVLAAAIALLLTPLSTPVWLHAPQLAFLQFPWRFLAILAPALALVLALSGGKARTLGVAPGAWPLAGTLVLATAVAWATFPRFYQRCDADDTVAARLALFHSTAGTEPTDEYTPNTADEETLGHANPPYWLAETPAAPPPPGVVPGPLRWPLDLDLPAPATLVLNLRDYPAWRIARNGLPVAERLERPDGLIALPMPAGRAHLTAAYAHTPDETAGEILSTVSLAALLVAHRRRAR